MGRGDIAPRLLSQRQAVVNDVYFGAAEAEVSIARKRCC
jgi:hypothetical protein